MRKELEELFTEEEGGWKTFICTCSEDGIIEAGRLKQEVRRLLQAGDGDPRIVPVTPGNFLTMIVTSLNWDFNAYISSIANDMWSGVTAESWDKDDSFKVYAQCDEVEDGIAAAWYAFWLRKERNEEGKVR